MKIALLLSILCAASVLVGCSTANQGGTSDQFDTTTGSMQTAPLNADPSLPQDPYAGPSIPPP